MGVEIVSVHIRKCGGISFRNILSRIYGNSLSVNYPTTYEEVSENTRVIHGHIQASAFSKKYPTAKLITWMRSPLERYVSRYFYIKYHFADRVEKMAPLFQRIVRGQASFRDFLEEAAPTERVTWYLDGVALSKFYFVGIMEHYQEELEKLAQMLGWQGDYSLVHWNRTVDFVEKLKPEDVSAYQAFQVSDDDRLFFNQRYAEENQLYAEALGLKNLRGK